MPKTNSALDERVRDYAAQVQIELSNRVSEDELDIASAEATRMISEAIDEVTRFDDTITAKDKAEITRHIMTEFLAYGPIQEFLDDPEVTEVMVNAFDRVFVERDGVLSRIGKPVFSSNRDVTRLIDKIASENNKHCDNQVPYMDARLKDGSRVNAIVPPLARFGPTLTVRKFPQERMDAAKLISIGAASIDLVNFLAACVQARCNILVSGGTGSGKTTLLNILSGFIPANERVITIEDTAELKLDIEDWASLEARTANADGRGKVTIHTLVKNALRMRPDRIIVGECRSDETVEMLQAMNTGHDGSLTTIHANNPRAAFLRIETMVQATQNLSERNIDKQIATAIQLVVQLRRYRDGSRKISEVVALTGTMEGDVITTTPLFEFIESGVNEAGMIVGEHVPTTNPVPDCIMERIETSNAYFDSSWFEPGGGDLS